MNKAEKTKFVRSLCDSVRDSVIAKIEEMPENWDGIELREYLAEKFNMETCPMSRSRKRSYNNAVAVSNL